MTARQTECFVPTSGHLSFRTSNAVKDFCCRFLSLIYVSRQNYLANRKLVPINGHLCRTSILWCQTLSFVIFLPVQAKRTANRKFVLINGHPGRVSSVDRPLFWVPKRREDLSSLARDDRSLAARLLALFTWELKTLEWHKKARMIWLDRGFYKYEIHKLNLLTII